MTQAEAIARYENTHKRFVDFFEAYDDETLTAPLMKWSPRDILAHLVGWYPYTVTGCTEVQQGLLPFYEENAGENCCNINAGFIRQFADTPASELLTQFRDFGKKLIVFMESVPAENYSKDFGVRYGEELVTVGIVFKELTEDYEHHEKQLQEWAKAHPA